MKQAPEDHSRDRPAEWRFVLYTAGPTRAARKAESALHRMCERFVPDSYAVDVVNILEAGDDAPLDVLVVPTVVRISPPPERRVVGDLSQTAKAVAGLGLDQAELEVDDGL